MKAGYSKRVLLVLAFLGLATAARGDASGDAWASWADNFDTAMAACVKAGESLCLSKAFASRERPALEGTPPDVAGDLYRDLRTADVLLHQSDARDQLWRLYGIDGSAYLGTGYSVPLTGPGARDYAYAAQREFFVPNLCAETVDTATCPASDANVWTWHLDSKTLTRWLDRPIAKLLRAHAPVRDRAGFAKRAAAHAQAGNIPPLLVRFGSLQPAFYKGTFGRPGASRVFFADYAQVRAKTLRGAMTATGASTLIDNPDPPKTFFIWIYAPGSDPRTTAASWKSLYTLLSAPAQ